MSFLLDTNVVSEWVKPRPNPGVVAWIAEADEDRLFLSVVTLAELRHGIDRLPPGNRRRRLDEWLHVELPARFEGRLVDVGAEIANRWGHIVALGEDRGRPLGIMDAFIAATAEAHSLTLVTRNTTDFAHCVSALINPWAS